jgi:hypothetical protein
MPTKFRLRPVTIFTKVDRSWRKLKRRGIVGVRGLCCGTCSSHEGGNRMDKDKSLVGYAYYHVQDREIASFNGRLYIGYGARNHEVEGAGAEIGEALRGLFTADGFTVEWNGSSSTRIKIMLPKED